MNKMKCFILVGCSASGKSTWANEYINKNPTTVQLEFDIIRESLLNNKFQINTKEKNIWQYWKFKNEDLVDESFNVSLNHCVENGLDIICSNTNLNYNKRELLKFRLEFLGYEVEIKVFGLDLSLEDLWKRDTYRKNSVSHSVIAKQYQTFRKEFPKYILKDVTNKPEAVIFDLDGTLAIMKDRSPYEWMKVSQDLPNELLFISMIAYFECGYRIIIMSGRNSVCRQLTIDWITENLIKFNASCGFKYELHMRKETDDRSDTIVKQELFYEHIDGNYNVIGVYDDRPKVVRLWQDMGFKTYAVGSQYIEF